MNLVEKEFQTAKDGFKNEIDIINKFNNWQSDNDAQKCYNLKLIQRNFLNKTKLKIKFYK